MIKEEKGQLIILKREKESVRIDKEHKTVEFFQVSYSYDDVLKVAHEIAETFNEDEEPTNPDDGSWKNR